MNVVSRGALLRAQQLTKQHQNLLTQISIYYSYFVELDKELEDEIIARTECD